MQHDAPWDLTSPEQQDDKNSCIYMCAESIRICGILLQPFMPAKMKQLLDTLGVAEDSRLFINATFGSDADYGDVPAEQKSLFPALTSLL